MSEENPKKEIHFFIEDANLYTLWVYSRPDFYPKADFGILEITPLWFDESRVFNFLKIRLEMAGVPFGNFLTYNDNDYAKAGLLLADEKLSEIDKKQQKIVKDAYKKFQDDDFGIREVDILSQHLHSLEHYFYFEPDYADGDLVKMREHIDEYIDLFLNTELFVYDRNYFIFERQKQIFVDRLKKMSAFDNYGSNFVVSEPVKRMEKSESAKGFLFIHTLYALQKLRYITVMRLWHERTDEGYTYHANIVVYPSLMEEVTGMYQKENPTKIIESFDEADGILRFAEEEISLAQKGKQTYAVLLFKTLLKWKSGEWVNNDEIFDDWKYSDDDIKGMSKNALYYAGRGIIDAVAKKTQIIDFLECKTKKIRINPKYRKVDE